MGKHMTLSIQRSTSTMLSRQPMGQLTCMLSISRYDYAHYARNHGDKSSAPLSLSTGTCLLAHSCTEFKVWVISLRGYKSRNPCSSSLQAPWIAKRSSFCVHRWLTSVANRSFSTSSHGSRHFGSHKVFELHPRFVLFHL
ncbi:hypothetical protein M378DRAFT_720141 [Amanita muscaria Koide BX008]|uniref:Uncharacterized protein n=1 Tax=Amanita muscaria (strain Koide BX008) TaxID=946122 RepID=A0A0C2X6M8_AMAMK|nr:hypothetical protein M378DRAFT_720141 [Amanita muscaria Koide BX008]